MKDEKRQNTTETDGGFSDAEKAAMKERSKELKREKSSKSKTDGEQAVMEKINEMAEEDKKIASSLHELIKQNFPQLSFKTWYGFLLIRNKAKSSPFFRHQNVLM